MKPARKRIGLAALPVATEVLVATAVAAAAVATAGNKNLALKLQTKRHAAPQIRSLAVRSRSSEMPCVISSEATPARLLASSEARPFPASGERGGGLLKKTEVIRAWGRILRGYRPNLSIEITRECPLRCPGCYAYEDAHIGNGVNLRQMVDKRGDELVRGVLGLIDRYRPLHVSIVGGEPLVRYRELEVMVPRIQA